VGDGFARDQRDGAKGALPLGPAYRVGRGRLSSGASLSPCVIWYGAFLIVAFGLLYLCARDPVYDPDQVGYVEGARSILAGQGYRVPRPYSLDSLLVFVKSGFTTPPPDPGYAKEVRPILYGYILAAFMWLVGSDVPTASMLSVLTGLVSLGVVFGIAQRRSGLLPAVLATALTGFSYFFWRASVSVMSESVAIGFGAVGAALFLMFLRNDRPMYLTAAFALYGLATATRLQQAILPVASGLVYIATNPALSRRHVLTFVTAGIAFLVPFVPQYYYSSSDTLLYTRVPLFSLRYLLWVPEILSAFFRKFCPV
jgi:4-amino-4-deoxy-L-arabinose transferase-like glycosyltransferase